MTAWDVYLSLALLVSAKTGCGNDEDLRGYYRFLATERINDENVWPMYQALQRFTNEHRNKPDFPYVIVGELTKRCIELADEAPLGLS